MSPESQVGHAARTWPPSMNFTPGVLSLFVFLYLLLVNTLSKEQDQTFSKSRAQV